MHDIEKSLSRLRLQIKQQAETYGRRTEDICLLAVSKTRPVADIEQAFSAGQRDFGESYLQEAAQKIIMLASLPICWHFIGPVQSNKTKKISQLFDWVHSVERFKIARRLSDFRPADKAPLNILLQVNIEDEPAKSGISLNEILPLAAQIDPLPQIKLRGLMAIPAIHKDFKQQRNPFAKMSQALIKLQKIYPDCDTLSMGMSGDMNAAIAEGSTLVRIGTAIFGKRNN